jgi:hypothetical protein
MGSPDFGKRIHYTPVPVIDMAEAVYPSGCETRLGKLRKPRLKKWAFFAIVA